MIQTTGWQPHVPHRYKVGHHVCSCCLVNRSMSEPWEVHWQAANRIMRYLRGTRDFAIMYKRGDDDKLKAYT